MASSNEVDFDLRETHPLPRNILQDCGVMAHGSTGQRMNPRILRYSKGCRDWLVLSTSQKVSVDYLTYPTDIRDSAESGLGQTDNRCLNYLVESISMNVGGPCQGAKASSPPIPDKGVGAAIVVRGWESQPHGEGPQSVGISRAK